MKREGKPSASLLRIDCDCGPRHEAMDDPKLVSTTLRSSHCVHRARKRCFQGLESTWCSETMFSGNVKIQVKPLALLLSAKKDQTTTPNRIRKWSPTLLLTGRYPGCLRRSDGMRNFLDSMVVDEWRRIGGFINSKTP